MLVLPSAEAVKVLLPPVALRFGPPVVPAGSAWQLAEAAGKVVGPLSGLGGFGEQPSWGFSPGYSIAGLRPWRQLARRSSLRKGRRPTTSRPGLERNGGLGNVLGRSLQPCRSGCCKQCSCVHGLSIVTQSKPKKYFAPFEAGLAPATSARSVNLPSRGSNTPSTNAGAGRAESA